MNGKKFLVIGLLSLFIISMFGGVFARDVSSGASQVAETLITAAGGFLGTFLEPFFGEKELLSRMFFALLLGMIVYSIIGTIFKDSKIWIQWIITGAITSLALIGLPVGFLESVRTSYGAMGAVILVMIPFIIVFTFSLRTESLSLAKATWAFYAAYYLIMYAYQVFAHWGDRSFTENIPYLGGFAAGIIVFFAIGGIRKLIFHGKIEGIKETAEKAIEEEELMKQIKKNEFDNLFKKP